MQIIFGDIAQTIRQRFTVLELDTFATADSDQTVTAWCVIEKIPLEEIGMTEHLENMHKTLLIEYRNQRWQFCLDALSHLKGKWSGEVDSFYEDLEKRVQYLQYNPPNAQWSPVRLKTA
jgi:hypothetical protein